MVMLDGNIWGRGSPPRRRATAVNRELFQNQKLKKYSRTPWPFWKESKQHLTVHFEGKCPAPVLAHTFLQMVHENMCKVVTVSAPPDASGPDRR